MTSTKQKISVIFVEKAGTLKESVLKEFNVCDLYKKCGFKQKEGFVQQAEWKMDGHVIQLFAKIAGKANNENKYEFPPPIASTLFFGNAVLISYLEGGIITPLTIPLWKKIETKLFGGFVDLLENSDEEEIDALKFIPVTKKTKKTGYLKDGFVVSDESGESLHEDEDEEPSLGEEDEPIILKKISKKNKKLDKKGKDKEDKIDIVQMDLTSELSEMSYTYFT